MRVLLTGARGFIGWPCLRLLAASDHDVHALSRHPPAESPANVSWHRADLLAPGAPRALVERVRPTHVLHLAWVTEHGSFWSDPSNLDWVVASLELARAAAAHGVQRVVWAGTCAEYDWSAPGPYRESTSRLGASSVYAGSKLAIASLLPPFLEQQGVQHAWGRVFFTFGPGEQASRLVPSVVRELLADRSPVIEQWEAVRDFLYVEDVAAAFVRVLESEVCGPINIASGRGRTVGEIVDMLAEALHREGLVRPRERVSAAETHPAVVGDNRRLVEETGWTEMIGVQAGLEKTMEQCRHAHHD